jgi:hypothetical protein
LSRATLSSALMMEVDITANAIVFQRIAQRLRYRGEDISLRLWLAQQELLAELAAQQQKLVAEFESVLGRNQLAWTDQAKNLAQQSLNGTRRAARDSTALLLEEAARSNAAAVRNAVQEGVQRLEESMAVSCRIAIWTLIAAAVALTASLCAILAHVGGITESCG